MATLHVTDVPDELYGRIREMAAADSRSLSGEVVALLDEAVRSHGAPVEHVKALEWILRNCHTYPPGSDVPDSVELLREDRAR